MYLRCVFPIKVNHRGYLHLLHDTTSTALLGAISWEEWLTSFQFEINQGLVFQFA
jgi:hypothetical protein